MSLYTYFQPGHIIVRGARAEILWHWPSRYFYVVFWRSGKPGHRCTHGFLIKPWADAWESRDFYGLRLGPLYVRTFYHKKSGLRASPAVSALTGFDPSRDKTQMLISDADKHLAFLELDDLALGRFARSYLIECERAFHKVAGDKEMPFAVISSMHGALSLIRIAHEANAGTYTLTNERVTVAAQPLGDWKITIKQTKAPAIAMEARQGGNAEERGHEVMRPSKVGVGYDRR